MLLFTRIQQAKYILGDIELKASYAYENLELPETHSIVISELEKSGSFYFQLYKDEDEINNLMERIQWLNNLFSLFSNI